MASPSAHEACDPYPELVVTALTRSTLAEHFRNRILVIGGARCVGGLRTAHRATGLRAVSLSPCGASEALASAELLLTSPGLTITVEAFAAGVPTLFLPPQNYSQWLILATLRELGLAPCALHWLDRDASVPVYAGMAEGPAGAEVRRAVLRLAPDSAVQAALTERLDAAAALDLTGVAARQRAWLTTLGANGAATIARRVAGRAGG